MYLGLVIGTVVATQKAKGLESQRLLVVQPLDHHRKPSGPPEVAVADGGLGTAVGTPRGDGDASARGGSLGTVCALVLVLVAGLVGSGELHDNSFLTHLATGRWITNGHLGRLWMGVHDPYLWTSNGRTWVVQSWFASVVYDAADRVAGAAGIRLLVAATAMALTACLWRLSAPGRTLVSRVIAVGGALAIGGTVWSERPLMFGLLFLALSLLAADGAMRTTWLVPVGWLWVNMHGSFPLGLVALGTLAVGARLDGESVSRELRAMRDLETLNDLVGLSAGRCDTENGFFRHALKRCVGEGRADMG